MKPYDWLCHGMEQIGLCLSAEYCMMLPYMVVGSIG